MALVACGTLLLAACGDDDPPTGTEGDFTFAVSPTTLSIAQGASAPVTATVTRTGGFAGAITGTVEGVPGGVTLTPLAIPTGSTSAQVTVSVADTVTAGTYTITVRANGNGVTEKTATVALTVTAASQPTLSVTLNPAALNIAVGSRDSTQATATRGGGFADSVSLAVSGAPVGMTVTAPVIGASGTTSMVIVAVSDSVAPGDYPLTITASGTGVESAISTLAVTVTSAKDYALSLTPDTLRLPLRGSGTSVIGITRSGGFSDSLTFALDTTPPTGITVTLPTTPIVADTTTVAVSLDSTVVAGSYPIQINVTGPGVPERTLVLTVVVTDLGNFTLTTTPASPMLARGDSTSVMINIARTAPHVAPITFTVTGLPAGVTASIQPDSARDSTATMMLVASDSAALGATTLTLTGMGGGVTAMPLSVPLTVTAATSGAGNVTYSFCTADFVPLYVAYQDGDGAWNRATAGANNTYTFNIASGAGGVAVVKPTVGMSTSSSITFGTVAELNAIGGDQCTTPATGRSFTGTVAGTSGTDFVRIVAGNAVGLVVSPATSYSLSNVTNNPFDLLATRFATNGALTARFIVRRELDPAANSELAVLDFESAEAFAPVARTLTIDNGLGEDMSVYSSLVLKGGAAGGVFYSEAAQTPATARTYYGLPEDKRVSTDLHVLGVTAVSSANAENTRTLVRVLAEAVDVNVALPAMLTAPTVANAGANGGNVRLQTTWPVQNDYDQYWSVNYLQSGADGVDVQLTMSKGYLGGSGPVRLATPDLTGLPGWNTAWGVKPGTAASWVFSASGWTTGFSSTSGYTAGSESRAATTRGEVTP